MKRTLALVATFSLAVCLLAAPHAYGAITVLANGTLTSSGAGYYTDLSGLNFTLENGVSASRLGAGIPPDTAERLGAQQRLHPLARIVWAATDSLVGRLCSCPIIVISCCHASWAVLSGCVTVESCLLAAVNRIRE